MSTLLTGATGFLGMEVLVRLLGDERPLLALVRGHDGEDADARLAETLDRLGVPAGRRAGVRAVGGDLTAPGLGLDPDVREALVEEIDEVVHCAASVSFDLPLERAREINVAGARRVARLAADAADRGGLRRLVHVSTAYVAGRHPGRFAEDDLDVGQDFRNTYEQTKAEAEASVREEAAGLPLVVVRPSIVVGESDSGWTPAFNVLYWPLRAFSRGLIEELPARADGRVDVVPVDYVADAIVHLLRDRPDVVGTVHVTASDSAVTVDELVDLACTALDRDRPRLAPLTGSELADRSPQAAQYLPYFDIDVAFDDARAQKVLHAAGIAPPPLAGYFDRLVAFAQDARWGKRDVTRAQARAEL